jgi:ribonuclease HI
MASKKGAKIRQGWRKPLENVVMLNVDASFDEDMGCGSIGAIISDSLGAMVVASNNFISHVVDAPMAEAYALKEGLMLAQHVGCNRVIVQSDCMEVVDIMGDGGFTTNSAAAIYDECTTIWLGFQEISIEHCERETNQVTHELVKRAMISKNYCIWDDDPPSFIVDLLSNDVTILDQ